MFTMTVFVLFGFALGAFLSFPAFAMVAIVCSNLYSLCTFDGTIISYIANMLCGATAAQLGFFFSVLTMVLYRRCQVVRNDR